MDHFLNCNNVVTRLVEEWGQYGKLIIAYDFDNTVYDYHNKGYSFDHVIQLLRDCKEMGMHLIVYTACEESKFDFIRDHLNNNNIPFDSINQHASFVPFQSGKIYYNHFLDDRAGLRSAYEDLRSAIRVIKQYDK
ncbi:hypothetical protein ABGV42_01005 [Paenibacillus pabuli]|uniref:hypothetical protein n=1 Tax=Paenibacillus pabuli TaxID=1472 RepID=UPI003242438A